jgi:hypothetical protein
MVANQILLKLCDDAFAPLSVSVVCFLATQTLFSNNPIVKPSWFMNIDGAMYYYIYFTVGWVTYPFLNTKYSEMSRTGQITAIVLAIAWLSFTIVTYENGGDFLLRHVLFYVPMLSRFDEIARELYFIPTTLLIIYANVLLAKALSEIPLLAQLEKETLLFCGTEHVDKDFLVQCFSICGMALTLSNPIATIAYSAFLLFSSNYTLVPLFNRYFPELIGKRGQSQPITIATADG